MNNKEHKVASNEARALTMAEDIHLHTKAYSFKDQLEKTTSKIQTALDAKDAEIARLKSALDVVYKHVTRAIEQYEADIAGSLKEPLRTERIDEYKYLNDGPLVNMYLALAAIAKLKESE